MIDEHTNQLTSLQNELERCKESLRESQARIVELERLQDEYARCRSVRQALLDISSDSLIVLDGAGTVLQANTVAARNLHLTPDELIGRSIFDIIPQDATALGKRWFNEVRDNQKPLTFKDERGGRVLGHRFLPFTDPKTQNAWIAVLSRDITESEKTLAALRESEARYRAIIEDQTELICRYLPDGRLSFVNEAYARYYGKTREELINTNFVPHIPEKDVLYTRNHINSLSQTYPVTSFEHRIIKPDGSVRWQRWTHRAVYDNLGNLVEYQAVGYDITERKMAEMEVRENRAFLHQVIDTVPSPIFVKDRDGKFVLVNKAMAELYGASPRELIGKTGADFNPDPEEVATFRNEDYQVIESQRPFHIPPRPITNAQGKKRWFITNKLPIVGKQQVLGVATDISDRIDAENERSRLEKQMRQAHKMQALGTLAGGIAHDFNNMIFAILGFTRLAFKRAPEDDPKLKEYLEQIQSAGKRASDLVRQILTFSRQTEQERKPMHVGVLFKEVGKMLQATLPKNIDIRLNIDAETDTVLGDPSQIHQVLMNLCTNAAHAMREQGGVLELSLTNTVISPEKARRMEGQPPGRFVEIKVSDTGHGIPPEIIDQIFDPFFTTKKPGEGTGMGLSVVHGIIKNHGGAIHVQSLSNRGTTFQILLPRIDNEFDLETEALQTIPGGQERVLFVEDEPLLVQMAHDMLSQLGYRVTTMTSPIEALEIFQANPRLFDVVVTDQTMPQMTGTELATRLLAIRRDIPVILVTGYSSEIGPQRAKELGINNFVMKPVVEEQLARTIRAALDSAQRKEHP